MPSAQSVLWRRYRNKRSTLHLLALTLLLTSFICLNGSASPPAGTVVSLGGPPVPADLTNVVAVSAGVGNQCLAIRSDGTVVGWGSNLHGEATPPAGLSNAVAVAAGRDFSVVLKSDGTITTWGFSSKVEDMPAELSGVIGIAAGTDHTVVVKADGTVVTWGGINVPPPLGDSDFVAVAASSSISRGLRSDGTVVLPGFFPGTTTVISNVVGIAAGGFDDLVMVHSDGTVRQASGYSVSVTAGLSNVVAVSSGLALLSDGTVVGLNGTTAPAGLTNVTAIAGRVGNGLLITTWPVITQPPQSQAVNGNTTTIFSVVAAGAPPLSFQWRKNGVVLSGETGTSLTLLNVQPTDAGSYDVIVSNPAGSVTSLAATLTVNGLPFVLSPPKSETLFPGMKVSFAVSATGSQPLSYQWLKNGVSFGGSSGATLSLNNVQLADAGSYSVIVSNTVGSVTSAPAVLTIVSNSFVPGSPGTVVGLGSSIVPPGLTDVVAVSAGVGGHCLAIRSDGTVVGWGANLFGEATPPAGLSNAVAVAAGRDFSVVLKSDGTITTWGFSSKIKNMPAGLSGVIGIAAGTDHTVVVKADGTVVTWGGIDVPPPLGDSDFVAVAASSSISRGLRSDGTVVLPGFFPGTTTVISNVVGIAAGGFDNLVMLQSDGTVRQVSGFNVSVPEGLSNVVAVSSGLALRSDGTVVGLNGTTAPAGLANVTAIAGRVGNGLVITTNPPAPLLMASSYGTNANVLVTAPVSVSGYGLEAAENPSGPYTLIETFTNAPSPLVYPQNEPKRYFRLRKL